MNRKRGRMSGLSESDQLMAMAVAAEQVAVILERAAFLAARGHSHGLAIVALSQLLWALRLFGLLGEFGKPCANVPNHGPCLRLVKSSDEVVKFLK